MKRRMREHDEIPGRLRGHVEPGSFFNRVVKDVLAPYVEEVLAVLVRDGVLAADEDDRPRVQVMDAEAFLGSGQVALEVETDRTSGLPRTLPLRVTYEAGKEHLRWSLHGTPITTTPGTWGPESAASRLTLETLRAAYDRFRGRSPGEGHGRETDPRAAGRCL